MTRAEMLQVAKPILFNTEMVKAILEGRKTVTRRVVKHDVEAILNSPYHKEHPEVSDKQLITKLCMPPYQEGGYIYVRETWGKIKNGREEKYVYRADGRYPTLGGSCFINFKWKPSLHMPKEATRIFLKVKDVRVAQLNNMNLDDFLNEGITVRPEAFNDPENAYWQAKDAFSFLWNSTIKKEDIETYGWEENPWVWVIEFEQIEPDCEV